MAAFPNLRVAAIQATPAILDAERCVQRAERLLHDAADRGAQLAVLPECFIPLYPSNAWARGASGFGGWDELWEQLWLNAVDVPGPLLDRLIAVCREREHERLFHGIGAGDDLAVIDAAGARVGGLICWENRMPLARYAVYRGGPQIWVAPTADDSDGWLASMRHIAIESGAFVISVPQYIPASAFPDDFPVSLPDGCDVFGRGGAVVIEPTQGDVIAGPLYDEEGIVIADCDLRRGLHAKRWFDSVGHYSRADVLPYEFADIQSADE